jgi:hypothetical protein
MRCIAVCFTTVQHGCSSAACQYMRAVSQAQCLIAASNVTAVCHMYCMLCIASGNAARVPIQVQHTH